jgi:hypothetical protein
MCDLGSNGLAHRSKAVTPHTGPCFVATRALCKLLVPPRTYPATACGLVNNQLCSAVHLRRIRLVIRVAGEQMRKLDARTARAIPVKPYRFARHKVPCPSSDYRRDLAPTVAMWHGPAPPPRLGLVAQCHAALATASAPHVFSSRSIARLLVSTTYSCSLRSVLRQ